MINNINATTQTQLIPIVNQSDHTQNNYTNPLIPVKSDGKALVIELKKVEDTKKDDNPLDIKNISIDPILNQKAYEEVKISEKNYKLTHNKKLDSSFIQNIKKIFKFSEEFINSKHSLDFKITIPENNLLKNNNSELIQLDKQNESLDILIDFIGKGTAKIKDIRLIVELYGQIISQSSLKVSRTIADLINNKIKNYINNYSLLELIKKLFIITNKFFKIPTKEELESFETLTKNKIDYLSDLLSIQFILLYSTEKTIELTDSDVKNNINKYLNSWINNDESINNSRIYSQYKLFLFFNSYINSLKDVINSYYKFYYNNYQSDRNYLNNNNNIIYNLSMINERTDYLKCKQLINIFNRSFLNEVNEEEDQRILYSLISSTEIQHISNQNNNANNINVVYDKDKFDKYIELKDKISKENFNLKDNFILKDDSNINISILEPNLSIETLMSICNYSIVYLRRNMDFHEKNLIMKLVNFLQKKNDNTNDKLIIENTNNKKLILNYEKKYAETIIDQEINYEKLAKDIKEFIIKDDFKTDISSKDNLKSVLESLFKIINKFIYFVALINSLKLSSSKDIQYIKLGGEFLTDLKNVFLHKCYALYDNIKSYYFLNKISNFTSEKTFMNYISKTYNTGGLPEN